MTDRNPDPTPTRTIERTFEVSVPVDRAWSAQTDPAQIANWFFRPIGGAVSPDGSAVPGGFDTYGTAAQIEILGGEPQRWFRYAETGGPVPKMRGYAEVTVTFEEIESGTRITITRSGFGEGPEWDVAMELVGRGLEESIADFVLYVETGAGYPRHAGGSSSAVGVTGRSTTGGVRVEAVEPDSFGSRIGLRAGDILIELAGAPVFGNREVAFFQREHERGEHVEAAWVRDGKVLRAKAELGGWSPKMWGMPDLAS